MHLFIEKKRIHITDIQRGWVDTDMAKEEKTFWMASTKEAALQIFSAINKKQTQAYVTSRCNNFTCIQSVRNVQT